MRNSSSQRKPTVREFKPSDEIPEGDYVDFKRRFAGLFLDEMEEAYRKAFNKDRGRKNAHED